MGPAMAELIDERRAYSYRHQGFWSCMDTYKEKQTLDEMYDRGNPPWEVWKHAETHSGTPSSAETASGQGSGCQPLPVDQASTVQVAANAN
jgi:NDP-sugar pyrophosphorylase family protein